MSSSGQSAKIIYSKDVGLEKPAALKGTMDRNAKYRRLLGGDDTPIDAVRIRLIVEKGDVIAEVEWPENGLTGEGDYFYATHVPLALERSLDVKENYGFNEIVVVLDDERLWNPAWGQLI